MITKFRKYFFMALAGLAIFSSCAEEKDESERSIHERILKAYVDLNCPNADVWDNGLVMIDFKQGTGDTLNWYQACYVELTTQILNGTHAQTTDEELAKELGWYSKSNHYGPDFYEVGFGSTYSGLEQVLVGMREGAKAKFILPPWLTNTRYQDNWNLSTSFIYDIELVDVVNNIYTWEADTMKAYANTHYPGLDTLAAGIYFKTLHDAGADTISSGTVKVHYVGRLLDGWVFDTNIADTARKYDIYVKSKEYTPLEVNISEDLDMMAEDNSLVKGFCRALQEMDFGDKAFTMFNSEMGYQSSGSGEIGPYQPLIFWLYIEPEEEN